MDFLGSWVTGVHAGGLILDLTHSLLQLDEDPSSVWHKVGSVVVEEVMMQAAGEMIVVAKLNDAIGSD